MSGVPAEQDSETTDYRTTRQRAKSRGLRAKLCLSGPYGDFRLRKNDRRTYGEVTGVIWLQTSCQPVGIFTKTMLLWNWPLVALPLY